MIELVRVLLPAPGAPGETDGVAGPAHRIGQSADRAGIVVAALDQRQQPGERAAVTGEGSLEQLGSGTLTAAHVIDLMRPRRRR
jgi:hypothetical protein